jgi:membrane-bound lytic murein transglycosylase D
VAAHPQGLRHGAARLAAGGRARGLVPSRPEYIARFVDRGSLYLHYIVEQVEKRNMPMEIALLPVIESAFNPKAYSRAKASGIWQFIPSTGKNYGLAQDWWKDNRRDIVAATDAALNYLAAPARDVRRAGSSRSRRTTRRGTVARAIAYNQKKGCRRISSASARARPRRATTCPS